MRQKREEREAAGMSGAGRRDGERVGARGWGRPCPPALSSPPHCPQTPVITHQCLSCLFLPFSVLDYLGKAKRWQAVGRSTFYWDNVYLSRAMV